VSIRHRRGHDPLRQAGRQRALPRDGRAAAARAALDDAGIAYDDVEQAYAGYVYGDSTCGQKALYQRRHDRHPDRQRQQQLLDRLDRAVPGAPGRASGAADCVLVLGFEQMSPGALGSVFTDRPSPFDDFDAVTDRLVGKPEIPLALRYFGGAGLAHMKNTARRWPPSRASAPRPAAMPSTTRWRCSARRSPSRTCWTRPMIWPGVMTRLMACPPTCGAAAAVLVSEEFAQKHGLRADVHIAAQAMTTDRPAPSIRTT
jgi:sterol carrier protein 2